MPSPYELKTRWLEGFEHMDRQKLRQILEEILRICDEPDHEKRKLYAAVLIGEVFGGPGFLPSRRLTDEELDALYNQGKGLSYPFNKEDKCEGRDP